MSRLPASPARPPAVNVSTIFLVVGSKFLAQRGLFVEEHKQMNPGRHRGHRCDERWIRMSKDHPEPDPSRGEAQVHGIAHMTVKSDYYQGLRRSDGRGRAVARPSKIPNTPQGDRKPQKRRNRSQPAPTRRTRQIDVESQPARQQPEPKG